jgi:hypothetical protein
MIIQAVQAFARISRLFGCRIPDFPRKPMFLIPTWQPNTA